MNEKKLLGRWGEDLAAAYLRKKHYTILSMGYSCRLGEIDVIAENRQVIAFVEVKLRRGKSFAEAREYVDGRKQARIMNTARFYLASHPTEKQPRFDVAEIYAPEGSATERPVIHYFENAFWE